MGYVPYVGFATHHRATVMTRLCLFFFFFFFFCSGGYFSGPV
jgi:hypothetical protein